MSNQKTATFVDLDGDTVEFDRLHNGDILIRTKREEDEFNNTLVLLKRAQIKYLSTFLLDRDFQAVTVDLEGNVTETKEEK